MNDAQEHILIAVARLDPDAYVVGGAVRDRLAGFAPQDLDVVLSLPLNDASEALAVETGARLVVMDAATGPARGHVRLVTTGHDGAMSNWVDLSSHGGELTEDLARRDFTINAMAVQVVDWNAGDLTDAVVDPFDGAVDLGKKILRETKPGNVADDPVRALRAARFATRYNLTIEASTLDAARDAVPGLKSVSQERVRDEIYLIFGLTDAMRAVKIMDEIGALTAVFPELEAARGVEQPPNHHYWDVFEHCVQAVGYADAILDRERRGATPDFAALPWRDDYDAYFEEVVGDGQKRSTLLKLAALLHDISKPETKSIDEDGRTRFLGHGTRGAEVVREILERLRCSRRVIDHVSLMVQEHLRPLQISPRWDPPSRRALFRYYRDLGDTVKDTVFLSLADYLAARGPRRETEHWQGICRVTDVILDTAFESEESPKGSPRDSPRNSKVSLLLNGNDLQRHFGLPPGPQVGHLLGLLWEAEATGRIQTREEAIKMLRSEISRSESIRGRTD